MRYSAHPASARKEAQYKVLRAWVQILEGIPGYKNSAAYHNYSSNEMVFEYFTTIGITCQSQHKIVTPEDAGTDSGQAISYARS